MTERMAYRSLDGERLSPAAQLRALASLACTLGWLFAYPSRKIAAEAVSDAFADRCCELFAAAAPAHPLPTRPYEKDADAQLRGEAACKDGSPAALRRECTQLFYAPNCPVPLCGSRWVRRRTLLSRKIGERSAVEQEYRRMGVVRKPGVTNPSDHLSSELDYLAFLCVAEADALDAADAALAREFRGMRESFQEDHLGELACAVSHEILARSGNPHLRFFARLLRAFSPVERSC